MEIKDLLKCTPGELTDMGICPTCFNREQNGLLYGDNKDKMLYEDEEIPNIETSRLILRGFTKEDALWVYCFLTNQETVAAMLEAERIAKDPFIKGK